LELKERVKRGVKAARKDFARTLDSIDPTYNNYPERLVSHFYIRALAQALKTKSVLQELPVTGKASQRADNHVDALIFNDSELVVAEFKVGWAPSHWEALAKDLNRLRGPVAQQIARKFTDKQKRTAWIFIGADCWQPHIAEAWKLGKPARRWTLPSSLGNAYYRDYIRVWRDKGKGFNGYYLTWALFKFDEFTG